MNRDRVRAELPPAVVAWLEANGSSAVWRAIRHDLAFKVAAILLLNDGEAGVAPVIYAKLCQHPSPAVRALAQSASWPPNRRWRKKTVALHVANYFAIGFEALYQRVRWKQK